MFHENLKRIRQENKMSQEEVADRLHVARQTLSKWERGLSVPDADLLIQLSEVLQVSVSVLLESKEEKAEIHDVDIISKKLEAIDFTLAKKNEQSKKIWKVCKYICVSLLVLLIIYVVIGVVGGSQYKNVTTKIEKVEGNKAQ